MELSFGQYANLGPVAIYKKFCPLFQGLGYGMVIVSAIVMLYYNLIIAWTLFYMFASFNSVLPWQKCEEWSTVRKYNYCIYASDMNIHVQRTQLRFPMLSLCIDRVFRFRLLVAREK
jgi:SNF family Na+-dependent transporter